MSGTSEFGPFRSGEESWLEEVKGRLDDDFYRVLKKVLDKLVVDICYELDYHVAGDTEIDKKGLAELKDALKKIEAILNKIKIRKG